MNYQGEGSMLRKFDNTWFAWKWRIVGAVIGLIMAAPMFMMAAKADAMWGKVWHVESAFVTVKKYQNQHQCSIRRIPIYSESYQQGRQNSSGDLLVAMIIGGIFGHAFSGNNDGAAAGAVLGALIQNDNANNSGTGRFISGYEDREVCDIVRVPTTVQEKRYVVHWKKGTMRGHFFSRKQHAVGEVVKIN